MRDQKSNQRKVALFQNVGSVDWTPVFWAHMDQSDEEADESQPDGYVRLSPYVVVEFTHIEQGAVVEKQLEQLAKAEQKAREELQQRINQINDMRQKLLALSFKPAA